MQRWALRRGGQPRAPAGGGEKEGAPWLLLSATHSPPSASWPSLLPLALPLTWEFSLNELFALKSVLKETITSNRNAAPCCRREGPRPRCRLGSPLCARLVRKDGERVGGEFCHPGTAQTCSPSCFRGFSMEANALCCLVWAPPKITAVAQVV